MEDWWNRKIKDYRGFEIIHYFHYKGQTEYIYIAKDGHKFSTICLASEKAARNVIDSFHRAKTLPVYR